MAKLSHKQRTLHRRKRRVRKKVTGDAERPRLSVYRSLNHIYAQIIDDSTGRTLASASTLALKIAGGDVASAKEVGKAIAGKAKEHSIDKVQFDRSGRKFHGRVKALADAAREAGLQF